MEVTTDPTRNLIIAHIRHMLTVAEVEAFFEREQAAVRRMGLKSGEFDLLVITQGYLVQTQEVMDAFASLIINAPLKSRKMATVRDGALPAIQSRRIAKLHSSGGFFTDRAEAEAWLAA